MSEVNSVAWAVLVLTLTGVRLGCCFCECEGAGWGWGSRGSCLRGSFWGTAAFTLKKEILEFVRNLG